jgi:translation initiation factor IF-3
MSLNIDTHDFETKRNSAIKFLMSGDKVKVSIRFRGREMQHTNLGHDLLKRFVEGCSEYGASDKPAKMEGRSLTIVLFPKAAK